MQVRLGWAACYGASDLWLEAAGESHAAAGGTQRCLVAAMLRLRSLTNVPLLLQGHDRGIQHGRHVHHAPQPLPGQPGQLPRRLPAGEGCRHAAAVHPVRRRLELGARVRPVRPQPLPHGRRHAWHQRRQGVLLRRCGQPRPEPGAGCSSADLLSWPGAAPNVPTIDASAPASLEVTPGGWGS